MIESDERWVTVIKNVTEAAFSFPQWAYLLYPTQWRAGEKRYLPKALRDKLSRSGIPLVEPEPDARESFIPSPPAAWSGVVNVEEIRKRYEGEPRLSVVMLDYGLRYGWREGAYQAHFEEVLNYPLEWMKDEVREIPYTLFARLVGTGAKISANPEDVGQALNNKKAQAIHSHRLATWRKERAEKKAQAQAKHEAWKLAEAVKEEERLTKAKAAAELLKRAKQKIGA